MHISPTKFDKLIKLLEKEKRHPIITFHGTGHDAVLKNICKCMHLYIFSNVFGSLNQKFSIQNV